MSLNIHFISVFLVDHFTEFSSTDNWWKQVHFEIFPENFKTFLKCLQKMDGRFKELRVGTRRYVASQNDAPLRRVVNLQINRAGCSRQTRPTARRR